MQEYKENKQDLPDDKVLCDLLEVSLETLFYIKNYNYQTISINQKNEENDRELEEFIIAEDNSYDEILEKQSNIDLFAILKEILLPKEYYIIYYRYLSDDKKTLEKIAQEFGITREAIRQTEVKVLAKIKSYMTDDSQVYKTKVKELHEQGIMLNDYNLMPINIEKIILFLYIIDDLTEYEKELMYYDVFGKMKFSWYRKILNISDANFFSIKQSIKEKLKKVILNKSEFYSFKEHILQNKGIKILDFTLNKTILFDYIHLKRKYDDLSYFEIMNLINENNIKLFKQETSLLKKYFLQINFRNIMPKEETEVVYKILAKIDNKKRKNEKNSMILRRKK